MNTKLVAFAIVVASVFFMSLTIRAYRRNSLPTRIFFMWMVIWLGAGFFSLFPSLVDYFMGLCNMTVRMNFILLSAIAVLMVIVFYLSSSIAVINRKYSKLVQHMAELEYKLNARKRENKQDYET